MVENLLSLNPTFQSLVHRIANNHDILCPYDGITFEAESAPSRSLLELVSPAEYEVNYAYGQRRYYKHFLKTKYFTVRWEPVPPFKNAPFTLIRVNPSFHQITPIQLLDMIEFIVGDYSTVKVKNFDEKIDITAYSASEVAQRIYVAYKIKLNDYKEKKQTFYFGMRQFGQVKVYNKARQLGLKQTRLVRIERTVRYDIDRRLPIADFLLNIRNDVFKNMIMVDLDKFNHRTKLRRRVNQEGMFMKAYKSLSKKEQKAIKRHSGFLNPCMDLVMLFKQDLNKWMKSSPYMWFKVVLDKHVKDIRQQLKKSVTRVSHFQLILQIANIIDASLKPVYNPIVRLDQQKNNTNPSFQNWFHNSLFDVRTLHDVMN